MIAKPFKVARRHILDTIEHALDLGSEVTNPYPHYTVTALPYRKRSKVGFTGVRVTWAAYHQDDSEARKHGCSDGD